MCQNPVGAFNFFQPRFLGASPSSSHTLSYGVHVVPRANKQPPARFRDCIKINASA